MGLVAAKKISLVFKVFRVLVAYKTVLIKIASTTNEQYLKVMFLRNGGGGEIQQRPDLRNASASSVDPVELLNTRS